MAYYLKIEILSGWNSTYTQFAEIEFYNGTSKININELSIVEGSNTLESRPLQKAIDGNTTLDWVSLYNVAYPRYIIIKSNSFFNRVKHYGDIQEIYGIKDVEYYIMTSDTNPSRSDSNWIKKISATYPQSNYIVEHDVVIYKFLVKQNSNYYTINSTNYDSATTHNFTPLTLTGGILPNVTDIENYAFDDLSVLTNSMTVNTDTFVPINKFDNTAELKMYKSI